MWRGKEDVDKFSIGIECVGHHDKPMGAVQIKAIAGLVKELKTMYRLSDDKVVTHGHVAYGAPNKWHKIRHRGRKRCGMLFATPTVRTMLGLKVKPAVDVDVLAKRLVVGDQYLQKVLYTRADPMARYYAPAAKPAPSKPKPAIIAAKSAPKKKAAVKPVAKKPAAKKPTVKKKSWIEQ